MGGGVLSRARGWLLRHAAPEETYRRRLLRAGKRLLRAGQGRPDRPPRPCRPVDVYDARALRAFFGTAALRWSACDAEADVPGAVRLALGLLRERPGLRRLFPRAVSAGAAGEYCRWLCSDGARECGLGPAAVAHLRAVFAGRLGERVRKVYDHHADVRRRFPLALTPAGQRPFLRWLLTDGKARFGLRDEEILWFLVESAEDPNRGLGATYLRTPEWQQASDGRALLAWFGRRHGARAARLLGAGQADVRLPDVGDWSKLGVNVLGHFCHLSGLRAATLATVEALHRAGVATSCRDVPGIFATDLPEHSDHLGLERFGVTLLHVSPARPALETYAAAGLAPRPGVRRVGVWYWELEAFPADWVPHAAGLDEVWAPSRFIADSLRAALPVPVIDMPPGVELGEVPALPRQYFGLPDDAFLFLFLFDMSSTLERKNPLGLIRAFRRAFGGQGRAAQAIKVTRGDHDPANLARLRAAAEEAGVLLLDRLLSREECCGLLNACDCYVSLHRSEGFGLTMAEAMLLGKPVIATAYSGNLDFMTPDNSLLVGCRRVPIAEDVPFYPRGHLWAEPSVEEAADRMRWVCEHRAEARALGRRARAEAAARLALRSAGERMRRRLLELTAGEGALRRSA
jgi:glycosyltransferase involved in cell wall biosynthesis